MNEILIGFLGYLVAVLIIGLVTFRLNRTISDYLLAGRRLGPWVVAFSERASGESAWLLIGLPGVALVAGYGAVWPAIGCTFGIFFSWTFIARRLREQTEKYDAITIPGFLENRFEDSSHLLRWSATIIIIFFFTLYVAAQFLAAGKVLHATFGWTPFSGMIVGALIILFYTVMGGFFAVVWTDFFQGILMVTTLVVLPVVGFIYLGGIEGVTQKIAQYNPALLGVGSGEVGWAAIAAALGGLGIGLGYMGQPHLIVRFMAIKKPRDLREGMLIAVIWAILAFWGAMFLGIVGIGIFQGGLADQEQVMPNLATMLLPAGLAGILISGAIAAMMSTADSQLLVTTSAISKDIYSSLMNPAAGQRRLVMISRVSTLAIGVAAFILAYYAEALVYDLVLYAWGGLGAAFGPPILLTLWWKRTTKAGVFAGMLAGTVTVLIWYNVTALHEFLYELIPGFFLSLIATWVVSVATRKPDAAGL
jgi:sodium/proline symporter